MSNKELIKNKITLLGYELGCYNNTIEKLTKKELSKVIDNLDQEHTDIIVKIKGKEYIAQIATVDIEKDIDIYAKEEYINLFGDEALGKLEN